MRGHPFFINFEKEIQALKVHIQVIARRIGWLRKHRAKLQAAPEQAYIYATGSLDMDGLPHHKVIQAIRDIGYKRQKIPSNSGEVRCIDYTTELDGVRIRIYSGHPPPSCRIVEVEEQVPEQVIPAHVKKVRKMVCNPELAAVIATARKEPLA